MARLPILFMLLGALAGCDARDPVARAGLTPLTDPRTLTLHDMAMLADPPPAMKRIGCDGEPAAIARRLAIADRYDGRAATLIAWGMRPVGWAKLGARLWTLESEVSDPAGGSVQIVQRDYLMARTCAWWAIGQKVLEWRDHGNAQRAGEGRVLIH